MAEITVEKATKRFGAVTAVDGVSLAIKDGEFMVLVGPSGCGKTTLLRMIAGLAEADGGSISFDGLDITHEHPGQRNVAMVFQNYALFPHMTVERNLSFGLRLRHVPAVERRPQVAEVARLLRIEPLLGRYPRELSGGQKQRVALGRALIRRPVAFLFDEPLSNLDPALRVEMRAEIAALHRKYPITTVYVTHDQVEAMTMGDRIAAMNQGRLHQVGAPQEVYRNPGDLFTAGFIGSPAMNFIKCRVQRSAGTLRLINEDGLELIVGATDKLVLRAAVPADIAGSGGVPPPSSSASAMGDEPVAPTQIPAQLTLGIRPEHLRLCAADEPNAIGAEVTLVEELGREHIVYLRRGSQELRVVAAAGTPPRLGERVHAAPDLTRALYFDSASGARIAPPAAL